MAGQLLGIPLLNLSPLLSRDDVDDEDLFDEEEENESKRNWKTSKHCDSIVLGRPLFPRLVVSYFYCTSPPLALLLHELVSNTSTSTTSTHSSSSSFKEILGGPTLHRKQGKHRVALAALKKKCGL